MGDTTEGWNVVEPRARPYYDRLTIDDAIVIAKETCAEWSYADDAHGYCHDRSVLVVLVRELEALRRRGCRGSAAGS